jgi:DNA invertase Pin-like site-specific DNA recombinase
MSRAVAYYRVSTAKQGSSGLGLAAQQKAVEDLCAARGWSIIAPPFTEVESGRRADRPELLKAIGRCRLTGARLVIAKLDRLSRNAAFLLTLRDSGIEFVAADMPDANTLTVGIMALVAQQEREATSQRTKEALAAAKARGQRLGNPNGAAALRRAGKGTGAAVEAAQRNADAHAERLRPVIAKLQAESITSLGGIAAALNSEGMRTPRGARWHTSSVRNLLIRISAWSAGRLHPAPLMESASPPRS